MVEGCEIIGPDWRYRFLNDAAARQHQLVKEKLFGRTLLACRPDIEKTDLYPLLQRCMNERIPQKALNFVTLQDGSTSWYELSIQPAPDGILILSNDVSERMHAEQEIHNLNSELEQRVVDRTAQLTAANQELEAFSYSVSHDLRAPLRAMEGFSNLLLNDSPDQLNEQSRNYLNRIQAAARVMDQLISDLLKLSRVTRSDFVRQQVDLTALANEVAGELQRQEPHRLVEFIISPDLIVYGDQHLLKIVLDNLLSNAFKFTSKSEQACIQVGVTERSGEQVFYVRDNGVGFDMAYKTKLFTPFQRLHKAQDFPGTGIGLVTVYRIITRHGGRIWPEAQLNQGATFYFTLGSN
jgi:signal transduction histidine kinase